MGRPRESAARAAAYISGRRFAYVHRPDDGQRSRGVRSERLPTASHAKSPKLGGRCVVARGRFGIALGTAAGTKPGIGASSNTTGPLPTQLRRRHGNPSDRSATNRVRASSGVTGQQGRASWSLAFPPTRTGRDSRWGRPKHSDVIRRLRRRLPVTLRAVVRLAQHREILQVRRTALRPRCHVVSIHLIQRVDAGGVVVGALGA